MKDWIQRKEVERLDLLRLIAGQNNLPDFMIEKDWWVTAALEALFTSKLNRHLAFKGGTSLSKSWDLLNRFSEDVDIVIDKTLFGVTDEEELGSNKRTKLRKEARQYIIKEVKPLIHSQLIQQGVPQEFFKLEEEVSAESDKDPTVLLLEYFPISEITNDYTKAIIKIEIGVRALMEPTEKRMVSSLLAQKLKPEEKIEVSTVLPQRTFWEKSFLLHELFQKPFDKMEISRMSRHWYDLHCLFEADFGKNAMDDKTLFMEIRNHRKVFSKVPGIDYDSLKANSLNLFPPTDKKSDWVKDYEAMKQSYIYRNAPSLQELETSINNIAEKFKALNF